MSLRLLVLLFDRSICSDTLTADHLARCWRGTRERERDRLVLIVNVKLPGMSAFACSGWVIGY